MIGYLEGQTIAKKESLIVLVGGVGYQVFVADHLLTHAHQNPQQTISLQIYSYIKEDRFELYGFTTDEELELFKMILSISGVGPKTALKLIDQGSSGLITAVQEAKVGFFTAVPRVGKKLAQKIIIELKGKLGSLKELNLGTLTAKEQDILDALLSFGFEENQARDIMSQLDIDNLPIEQSIKQAIHLLSTPKA